MFPLLGSSCVMPCSTTALADGQHCGLPSQLFQDCGAYLASDRCNGARSYALSRASVDSPVRLHRHRAYSPGCDAPLSFRGIDHGFGCRYLDRQGPRFPFSDSSCVMLCRIAALSDGRYCKLPLRFFQDCGTYLAINRYCRAGSYVFSHAPDEYPVRPHKPCVHSLDCAAPPSSRGVGFGDTSGYIDKPCPRFPLLGSSRVMLYHTAAPVDGRFCRLPSRLFQDCGTCLAFDCCSGACSYAFSRAAADSPVRAHREYAYCLGCDAPPPYRGIVFGVVWGYFGRQCPRSPLSGLPRVMPYHASACACDQRCGMRRSQQPLPLCPGAVSQALLFTCLLPSRVDLPSDTMRLVDRSYSTSCMFCSWPRSRPCRVACILSALRCGFTTSECRLSLATHLLHRGEGCSHVATAAVVDTPAEGETTQFSHGLLSLCLWFEIFARSFFLLQLMTLVRLLVFAAPQRAERPLGNTVLRCSRIALRGAPLAFALLAVIPQVAAAPGGGGTTSGASSASIPVAANGVWPTGTLARSAGSPASFDVSCAVSASGAAPSSAQVHSLLEAVVVLDASPDVAYAASCHAEMGDAPVEAVPEGSHSAWSRAGRESNEESMHLTVLTLRLQRAPLTCTLPCQPCIRVLDFVEAVEDAMDLSTAGLYAVAVEPQPHVEHPVFLAARLPPDTAIDVPVCLQVYHGLPTVRIWLDYLPSPLCLQHVVDCLGTDWEAGSRVIVGSGIRFLRPDSAVTISEGTLIRVLPPHRSLTPAFTLSEKLRKPEEFFRRLEVEGPPDAAQDLGRYGLLQALVCDKIVAYLRLPGPDRFASVICSHADCFQGPVALQMPQSDVVDLHIRGQHVRLAVGVFPTTCTERAPVFLDARDLERPLRIVAAKLGSMPLDVFFELAGFYVEEQSTLEIAGTVGFDSEARILHIRRNDVIRVSRRAGRLEPASRLRATLEPVVAPGGATSTGGVDHGVSHRGRGRPSATSDVSGSHGRSRTPSAFRQRTLKIGGDRSSGASDMEVGWTEALNDISCPGDGRLPSLRQAEDVGRPRPLQVHKDLHDLPFPCSATTAPAGLTARHPFRQLCLGGFSSGTHASCSWHKGEHMWISGLQPDVLAEHSWKDTSAQAHPCAFVPTPAFRRGELQYRLAMSLVHQVPVLYNEGELPMPELFAQRHPDQGEPPDERGVDDGPPAANDDASDSSIPSMNCVAARIYCFQGPVRLVSLWIHLLEDIEEVVARAEILFNPDTESTQLVPLLSHPGLPFLVFLHVPRWWRDSHIAATFYVYAPAVDMCFLQTCFAGDTFEDAMPVHLLSGSTALSLYVPPTPGADDTDPVAPDTRVQDVVDTGSLVVIQRAGEDAPEFFDVRDHMRALPHDTAREDAPDGIHDPPCTSIALLGVGFEQHLVTLRPGPTLVQLAAALDYPLQQVFFHRQVVKFDGLVVLGKPVASCYAYRDTRIFGNPPRGRGIFVDPRAAGRPVCYRSLIQKQTCADELLRMLEVPVPPGYEAICDVGVRQCVGAELFTFEHGSSVVLWVEQIGPSSPVSGSVQDDDSGVRDDDNSEDGPDAPGPLPDAAASGSASACRPNEDGAACRGRTHATSSGAGAGRSRSPRQTCAVHGAGDPQSCFGVPLRFPRGGLNEPPGRHSHSGRRPEQSECSFLETEGLAVLRHIATPCRGAASWRLPALDTNSCSASDVAAEVSVLLPSISAPLTLLESAVRQSGADGTWAPSLPSEGPSASRQTLCLACAIPLSPFQQQVATLQCCLPGALPCAATSGEDWLDADLGPLLKTAASPLDYDFACVRSRLLGIGRGPIALCVPCIFTRTARRSAGTIPPSCRGARGPFVSGRCMMQRSGTWVMPRIAVSLVERPFSSVRQTRNLSLVKGLLCAGCLLGSWRLE